MCFFVVWSMYALANPKSVLTHINRSVVFVYGFKRSQYTWLYYILVHFLLVPITSLKLKKSEPRWAYDITVQGLSAKIGELTTNLYYYLSVSSEKSGLPHGIGYFRLLKKDFWKNKKSNFARYYQKMEEEKKFFAKKVIGGWKNTAEHTYYYYVIIKLYVRRNGIAPIT